MIMLKKLMNSKKKNNKGFSLIELVIVIAILAILAGILGPQYTKYVERSRKSVDATNLDEMVRAVKIYAADPASDLLVGKYYVGITKSGTTITDSKPTTDGKDPEIQAADDTSSGTGTVSADLTSLRAAVNNTIPKYYNTKLKSQKWKNDGKYSLIYALIEVTEDGGTTVSYGPEDAMVEEYMVNGVVNPTSAPKN